MFRDAVAADPGNTRAHLGLALFYSLYDRHVDSWKAYRNTLKTENNIYPYLFAAWFKELFKIEQGDERAEILELQKEIAADPNADEALRGQACESLGRYYHARGDISTAAQWSSRGNAIVQWTLIGPFENVSASGYERAFPPEGAYDTTRTYEGKNGVPARWFPLATVRPDHWIDHLCYFSYSNAVFYANTFVYSPSTQPIQLRVGTSGSLKAFLNDEPILACSDENNNALDTYVAATELQQGWNRILIKCGYSEISKCNFKVRITRPDGHPVEGMETSVLPHSYRSLPQAPVRLIDNFAEVYFKDRIRRNPDHIENYVLLADCYSRNDKAIEAELVLREAVKRFPECPLLLNALVEAYARGEKVDEMNQVLDRLILIEPDLPAALGHAFNRALKNEDFDAAQSILQRLEKMQPGSEALYLSRISYYSQRKQVDKIIETNAEALKTFPQTWDFVYLAAAISIQSTQKYDAAIELINNYLKHEVSNVALMTLADCYLTSSQIDKWEATFVRSFQQEPCSPGWYNKMAEVYVALQQYPKAEQVLKAALAICPNGSVYWSKLGDLYRTLGNTAAAADAYRAALSFNPTAYGARESLREILGKKSVFQLFGARDIDSLIKTAPRPEEFPNASGILLLDDVQRVVFDRGASMSRHELLVKLFKRSAIDDFKEYRISYNSNTQQLIVEKAVSIKKDGSQVKADVENGYVVFKSLDEGDCVYISWKIKDYFIGKLANHFWDTQYFDCYYPTKLCRYALLVPEGRTFHHRTQNMPDSPAVSRCDDGVMYEWTLADVPAIKYEEGMPRMPRVAKRVSVSSIPNWNYLVDWYTDLSHTKTRSSYEIQEQVAALFAGNPKATEDEKLKTIYNFIIENIRYSYVPFRQSGLVPQQARTVLVNRIGDCKDVATLCIAMLKEVGINAQHVLVNSAFEGETAAALPSLLFDHCIVAAETRRGLQYLDLTASNYPIGSVPLADVGAFALRVAPGPSSPGYLERASFVPASIHRRTTVTVKENNSVEINRVSSRYGRPAGEKRSDYRFKGDEERLQLLSEVVGREFPDAKVKSLSIQNLDEPSEMMVDNYSFEVARYVTESGRFRFMKLPWADALSPLEGLSYESRRYPFTYWQECDTLLDEMEVKLPKGYTPMDLKPVVSYTSPVASYTRTLRFAKGTLVARRQFVQFKQSVSPEEYLTFKEFYNSVVKEDNLQILMKE